MPHIEGWAKKLLICGPHSLSKDDLIMRIARWRMMEEIDSGRDSGSIEARLASERRERNLEKNFGAEGRLYAFWGPGSEIVGREEISRGESKQTIRTGT